MWHFTTTPGHRIRLTFINFELEPHQECTYDHIEVFDGKNINSHSLGRYCGSKLPHPITSSGNQMYMVFYSDASVQRKGFHASHKTGLHFTDKMKLTLFIFIFNFIFLKIIRAKDFPDHMYIKLFCFSYFSNHNQMFWKPYILHL